MPLTVSRRGAEDSKPRCLWMVAECHLLRYFWLCAPAGPVPGGSKPDLLPFAKLIRGSWFVKVATVEREIRKLIQAIKDGVLALSIKDELLSLGARKAELQSRLDAPEMPELHPRIADVYREKVGSLCLALEAEETRTGAAQAIRALVEAIVLEPEGDKLKITLKGDLAGMLSAARDSKRSPDTGDLLVQIKLVAGARNQRYLQLWSGAA